ncbi:hypothetical protein M407DRAFT_30071 [Tulasnella calospora MUT 4182]|uniref:Uncharacterized protein n=1 Tax=Tulasnella calospora MUT 4182 TaxID=1051891 RepID=A0A0C3Q8W4_9AGAM|nr:hypothetical protein M407DRAFT_30071 [Tulasnella calospora MUT 4182]
MSSPQGGQSTTAPSSEPQHEPLLLEAPSDNGAQQELEVGGTTVKLDRLGPLVVNSDGTLSRIANWEDMTEIEKERTYRILLKRNQIRLEDQKQKFSSNGENTP